MYTENPTVSYKDSPCMLARRGALWTFPLWLALAIITLLSFFNLGQSGGEETASITFLGGLEKTLSPASFLAIFGFPLGLPLGFFLARGAAGWRDAFKRGVLTVSALAGANLFLSFASAIHFTVLPYERLLPSESVFQFWFGVAGAAGYSLFGGLGGLGRYAALGVRNKPGEKTGV